MEIKAIKIRFGPFKITIGAERIRELLLDIISKIDWSEVKTRLTRLGLSEKDADTTIEFVRSYLSGQIA